MRVLFHDIFSGLPHLPEKRTRGKVKTATSIEGEIRKGERCSPERGVPTLQCIVLELFIAAYKCESSETDSELLQTHQTLNYHQRCIKPLLLNTALFRIWFWQPQTEHIRRLPTLKTPPKV